MGILSWTLQDSSFGATNIRNVAYNSSDLWVAVGNDSKIATSPDGINWTQRDVTAIFGGGAEIKGVAYGGGVWVIVSSNDKIAISDDGGVTWIEKTPDPAMMWFTDVAYGNSIFAVTGAGSNKTVQTSIDGGITWIAQITGIASFSKSIGYDSLNNLWVINGYGGDIVTSPDTINWTDRGNVVGQYTYGIAHNQIDLWVCVCYNGIYTSPNGIDWIKRYNSTTYGAAYLNNLWIAGQRSSTDGITWIDESIPITVKGVGNNGSDMWIVVGESGGLGGLAISDWYGIPDSQVIFKFKKNTKFYSDFPKLEFP